MPKSPAPAMFGPAFDRDPSPQYDWLRRHSPAYLLELPGGASTWLLTRYADVAAAIQDPRLSKRPSSASPAWFQANLGLPADHRSSLLSHMNNEDGADHQRLRRACIATFRGDRVQNLRTRTRELSDELLDVLQQKETADLVADFAFPLAMLSICELIGIPAELVAQVHHPARVVAEGDLSDMPQMLSATDELDRLCREVIGYRAENPGPDLVSDLLAQVTAGVLSEAEVAAAAFLVVIAGHETTVSLIASTVLSLLTHPEHLGRARDDEEHLALCIEEVLRRDSPLQNTSWRFVTEPLELAGQRMYPGDPVLLSLLAASRDPEKYPDPEAFRPGDRARSLAFGGGPHICIGAALARTLAATAVGAVLQRLPGMQLAEPEETLIWWPSAITRGVEKLPIDTGHRV